MNFLKSTLIVQRPLIHLIRKSNFATSSKVKTSIESIYQKKTQREHILLRPDTYVGSILPLSYDNVWILKSKAKKMSLVPSMKYSAGLYKIFDEILVNASDNVQRNVSSKNPKWRMNSIRVNVDKTLGEIQIWNDGKGVPIRWHDSEKMYIPSLVFGHLLTGSNFDDKIAKVTGGRNGFGAKLTNIFSSHFRVETVDSKAGLKFSQSWSDNMSIAQDPIISKLDSSVIPPTDYTCITFRPDLSKFSMKSLASPDLLGLFRKRTYDLAGVHPHLSIYFNDQLCDLNSFSDYIHMYTPKSMKESEIVAAPLGKRWKVGVTVSPSGSFSQVSFVNGIHTARGGYHVSYIVDKLTKAIGEAISKKYKDLQVSPAHIKHHLAVYVDALIENPSFDSQTKETLTTRPSDFGSLPTLSAPFIKRVIESTPIIDKVVSWARLKQQSELESSSVKTKRATTKKLLGIPKLDDANWAGSSKSSQTTLILTEGDSAKSLAVAGLSVIGRDKYGVYPLRGKLLNVRDASHRQVAENVELNTVKTILGLSHSQSYEDEASRKSLRYGKVMLMTDQDHDGSHIKGLFINFLHYYWPALLRSNDFLQEFITPIVKVIPSGKGSTPIEFFTLPEYESWRSSQSQDDLSKASVKYYKGLGTSTANEARSYFNNLSKHQVAFTWNSINNDDSSDGIESKAIQLAFSKHMADERKTWLSDGYSDDIHVDTTSAQLSYSDFVNKELILYSYAANLRNIPSIVDGLKPGQRKVLFAAFKRKLNSEIKVAQLAGYVAEHTAYHHGEVSLHGTIVNMAQDYTGSNNIPLLQPIGQFGTRLQGGKDAASARYIFTALHPLTRYLFRAEDDAVLEYQQDDGQSIQPSFYVPVIPLLLANGAEGLGTGWSTSIPSWSPLEIIDICIYLANSKLDDQDFQTTPEPIPWYFGFRGKISASKVSPSEPTTVLAYQARGSVEQLSDKKIAIHDLPPKKWTDDYKTWLNTNLVVPGRLGDSTKFCGGIKSLAEYHSEHRVEFQIEFHSPVSQYFEPEPQDSLFKALRLESSILTSNMHIITPQQNVVRYTSALDILKDWIPIRLDTYNHRLAAQKSALKSKLDLLQSRLVFTNAVVNGTIKVGNRSKSQLETDLHSILGLPSSSYDRLLSMPIWSLTSEKMKALQTDIQSYQNELERISSLTPIKYWLLELYELKDKLTTHYNEEMNAREVAGLEALQNSSNHSTVRNNKKKTKKNSKRKSI